MLICKMGEYDNQQLVMKIKGCRGSSKINENKLT